MVRHASRKLVIEVSLTHAAMRHLTATVPVVSLAGRQMPWRSAFAHLLQQVRATLKQRGVTPVTAIVLAGGASRMDFIRTECESAFPEVGPTIAQSTKPQYTVAYGLARWGRIQIQTDRFAEAVVSFCEDNVVPRAEQMADKLLDAVPAMITDNILGIIKGEFAAWQALGYTTIADMNGAIRTKIEAWLIEGLPSELNRMSSDLMIWVGQNIEADIKGLETTFEIPIGTLGSAVASSALTGHRVRANVDLKSIDATDGAADALGNVVGAISSIVVAVVMLNVLPVVLVIVVHIIASISLTLAGMVAAILIAHPLMWPILIAAGIAIVAGVGVKERVQEAVPGLDLPGWVRRRVSLDSINSKLEAKRPEIDMEIRTQFRRSADLRQKIIEDAANFFREKLVRRGEDARMLIA